MTAEGYLLQHLSHIISVLPYQPLAYHHTKAPSLKFFSHTLGRYLKEIVLYLSVIVGILGLYALCGMAY